MGWGEVEALGRKANQSRWGKADTGEGFRVAPFWGSQKVAQLEVQRAGA